MSPRTGRPTTNPKTKETRIRMSEEDVAMLEYCVKATGKSKSDIIREGIKEIYVKVKCSCYDDNNEQILKRK